MSYIYTQVVVWCVHLLDIDVIHIYYIRVIDSYVSMTHSYVIYVTRIHMMDGPPQWTWCVRWCASSMNESCHMSDISMRHVTHGMSLGAHRMRRVTRRLSHVTRITSCDTSNTTLMIHWHVTHVTWLSLRVTRLILCASRLIPCVTCLIEMSVMWHGSFIDEAHHRTHQVHWGGTSIICIRVTYMTYEWVMETYESITLM